MCEVSSWFTEPFGYSTSMSQTRQIRNGAIAQAKLFYKRSSKNMSRTLDTESRSYVTVEIGTLLCITMSADVWCIKKCYLESERCKTDVKWSGDLVEVLEHSYGQNKFECWRSHLHS